MSSQTGKGNQEKVIRGAVPVLSMPFDSNGAVDVDSLIREIDFCLEAGSQAIAFGMGSESNFLTDEERKTVWSAASRHLNGQLPLVVATAHPSHEGVIALTQLARDCGADCVMVNPELKTGESLVRLFRDLSSRVDLSIMLQDAGGNAPVDILLKAVREAPMVTCMKIECPGTPNKMGLVIEALREIGLKEGGERKVDILGGGNGNLLLEELGRGSVGTLPYTAIIDAFRSVCDLYASGDEQGAWEIYLQRILPLSRLAAAGGPAGGDLWMHKTIFERAGILRTNYCRIEAKPQPAWVLEKVWEHLERADLCISKRLARKS